MLIQQHPDQISFFFLDQISAAENLQVSGALMRLE
jgi:hypothetical protein